MAADLAGTKIVITGKFTGASRKALTAQLKELGATVSGSVSGKTQLLVAGAGAGSKLTQALEKGVPVFDETQLAQLLDGSHSFEQLLEWSKTFYNVEFEGGEGTFNQLGGLPPGVGEDRWPGSSRHLFTLDLDTMPALQARYPEFRCLSVFGNKSLDMYAAGNYRGQGSLVFSTQEQVEMEDLSPPSNAPKPWKASFFSVTPVQWQTWDELYEHSAFGYDRILGPPCWLQGEEDSIGFILQGGESFGVPGDGLLYLFEDGLYAQVT